MTTRFTRRQFFGISAMAASLLVRARKPCWELPPTHPKWCPAPTPSERHPKGLLLLF